MKETRTYNIGVIGLGSMGSTHLDFYAKAPGVRVVAVADRDHAKRRGEAKAGGNIEGQAKGGFDVTSPEVKKYKDGHELIADETVDVVDVCVPTPGHLSMGLASLEAGKHTLIEKPLGRTYEQAVQLADAAERAWSKHGAVSMCAMCMRFWPGWDWLKEAVTSERYGKVRAATFRRVTSHPGGPFYSDGELSGGSLLDLHIHDTDFVRHLFSPGVIGTKNIEVRSTGYASVTGEPDHVLTTYRFPAGTAGLADGALVAAEGSWSLAAGFGFAMRYTVNFERATADFDFGREAGDLLLSQDGERTKVELPSGLGYDHELAYFLDCVRSGRQAERVTLRDAAESVRLVEMERAAIGS